MKDDGAALDGRSQGHAVEFVDPEPRADPQDGAALLGDIKATILKLIYLTRRQPLPCGSSSRGCMMHSTHT